MYSPLVPLPESWSSNFLFKPVVKQKVCSTYWKKNVGAVDLQSNNTKYFSNFDTPMRTQF